MRAQLAGAIEFIHAPSVPSPAAFRPALKFSMSRLIASCPLYLIGPLTSGLWLVINCSGKPQPECGSRYASWNLDMSRRSPQSPTMKSLGAMGVFVCAESVVNHRPLSTTSTPDNRRTTYDHHEP